MHKGKEKKQNRIQPCDFFRKFVAKKNKKSAV